MTAEELKKVLEEHKHWIMQDIEDWQHMRANLQRADLRGADLRGADLRRANLQRADLQEADLRGADLRGADLRGADLQEADLRGADLQRADLRGADLQRADLQGVDLRGADLQGARSLHIPMACPSHGAFEGWKKCRDGKIVHLLIPEDAKRSSATGRKCRCNRAQVLEIFDRDGKPCDEAESLFTFFIYRKGEVVSVFNFNEDRFRECAPGIHFFITREEAENY